MRWLLFHAGVIYVIIERIENEERLLALRSIDRTPGLARKALSSQTALLSRGGQVDRIDQSIESIDRLIKQA